MIFTATSTPAGRSVDGEELRVHDVSRRSRNGFTIVELLVVVSIIGLLFALLLPALGKVHDTAKTPS